MMPKTLMVGTRNIGWSGQACPGSVKSGSSLQQGCGCSIYCLSAEFKPKFFPHLDKFVANLCAVETKFELSNVVTPPPVPIPSPSALKRNSLIE